MVALIYDIHELDKPFKRVLSVNKSRETAERALEKRMARLGKKKWGSATRALFGSKKKSSRGTGSQRTHFRLGGREKRFLTEKHIQIAIDAVSRGKVLSQRPVAKRSLLARRRVNDPCSIGILPISGSRIYHLFIKPDPWRS
jgi:hypothetical protein